MSIERCHRHDRTYDTDFEEECPACEREDFEADVEVAEAMIAKQEAGKCTAATQRS